MNEVVKLKRKDDDASSDRAYAAMMADELDKAIDAFTNARYAVIKTLTVADHAAIIRSTFDPSFDPKDLRGAHPNNAWPGRG